MVVGKRRSATHVQKLNKMSLTNLSEQPSCDAYNLLANAIDLLNQQVWCWGCDVMRAEGNWLCEIGFDRIVPPEHRKDCSSVYCLDLPNRRKVILRGFGVYYSDQKRGGVYLPRYEFSPKFKSDPFLASPPWSEKDLPRLHPPSRSQRSICASLVLDLIDWIRSYEFCVIEKLGVEYRRLTLHDWVSRDQTFIPAERIASEWRRLSFQVAANFDAYLSPNAR